jgi:threonine aldolase
MFAPDMGPFFVRTAAISVENTHNFAGGAVVPLADLVALRSWASSAGIAIHLDGARLWNAHVATGTELATYGAQVDVLGVCFSKGLGAPVGSMMVGSEAAIADARVWRKRLGGGMRQAGILAAAGLHALRNNVERLAEDHANAALLASALRGAPGVSVLEVSVPTNMVIFDTTVPAEDVVRAAAREGVLIHAVGGHRVRCVTHRDLDSAAVRRAASVLSALFEGVLTPAR